MGDKITQYPAVGIQLSACLSALGNTAEQIRQALTTQQNTLSLRSGFIPEKQVWVGAYQQPLIETVPAFLQDVDSRNLRFALTALSSIESEIRDYTAQFDRKRLAIILGTSTSGIADNEILLKQYFNHHSKIEINHYKQEMGSLAKGLQMYLGWEGPAYTISTACSSSAKAMAAGQRLIQQPSVEKEVHRRIGSPDRYRTQNRFPKRVEVGEGRFDSSDILEFTDEFETFCAIFPLAEKE